MIWLTWRQFRPQAIAAAGGMAVVAILLVATRPGLSASYTAAGLSACHADCATAASIFLDRVGNLDHVLFFGSVLLMIVAPALIGLFWGAPLIAREIEAGTHRIAWNQSVTRTRWTFVKLGLVGLAAIATAGLLSLMVTWWASPIDAASLAGGTAQAAATGGHGVHVTFSGFAEARLDPVIFAARGVAPLGYAAFAFALGVTAGVLLRRTLPAMAVTLVAFVAVQVLMPNFVRPHLLPPAHFTAPVSIQHGQVSTNVASGLTDIQLAGSFAKPGAWVLSDIIITPSGAQPSDVIMTSAGPEFTTLPRVCIPTPGYRLNPLGCRKTLAAMHLRQSVTYQPASRFWPLQWIETGIYLVLAAGLGWVCAWQVRRRRTP
jgi:ABC-2 family transporter protein